MVIDRDPQCNTHRVKEEIHIRLHSNNINRNSRIESPEAWLPLIKRHSHRRSVRQRTSEAKAHTNNGVRNKPISAANIACENIRLSSLFAAGDVSRETSPAAKSVEKRMFSQATVNNRPTRTRAWSHISSRVTSRRRLARQGL